jgi:quinol monooxygenase YgiN
LYSDFRRKYKGCRFKVRFLGERQFFIGRLSAPPELVSLRNEMFSRIVTMKLKPNHVSDLTKSLEETVLPLLRKQEGFRDELVFVAPGGADAIAVSIWDRKENAESYNQKAYPQVLQSLANLIEGTPQIKTLDVAYSTLHKIVATV